jgi:hypothetical protein
MERRRESRQEGNRAATRRSSKSGRGGKHMRGGFENTRMDDIFSRRTPGPRYYVHERKKGKVQWLSRLLIVGTVSVAYRNAGACASKASCVHYGGTCVSQSYSKVSYRGKRETREQMEDRGGQRMKTGHEKWVGPGRVSRHETLCEGSKNWFRGRFQTEPRMQ